MYLFDLQLLFFNTFQKVMNRFGWLDHGSSNIFVLRPILNKFVLRDPKTRN